MCAIYLSVFVCIVISEYVLYVLKTVKALANLASMPYFKPEDGIEKKYIYIFHEQMMELALY